jgi:transposase
MLDSMEVTMIRSLAERGVSISGIARQMGVDRKTVRRALKTPGEAAVRDSAPSMLDPYKEYLQSRLEVADFTAQRLFQDIQAQGYRGGYNLVKRFIAPLRDERHRQAVIRFETQPGHQGQVDWSAFGLITVDGVRKALSCFSMILGFSRYQFIEFTLSRNLPSFLACHVHAFEYFGGIPTELLYDNLKTAVLSHVDGTVEWQPTFTDFAGYYGFTPRACRPYRAQTKGKVERPFPYIRSNFFLGRTFAGLDNLNAQSRHWLNDTANVRVHGTTHERPLDRYQIERGHLRPLPQQAYRTIQSIFRSSTRDCVISYAGNFYSVPARYAARRHLRVEVAPEELTIFHNTDKIAAHRLCQGKHHRIIDPKHLEGLVAEAILTPLQIKLRELRALGPDAAAFIDGLVQTQTRLLPWHVGRLRETLFNVGAETIQHAMKQASRFQAYDARTVRNLCHKMRMRAFGGDQPVPIGAVLTNLIGRLEQGQVQNRNLQDYETVHAVAGEG